MKKLLRKIFIIAFAFAISMTNSMVAKATIAEKQPCVVEVSIVDMVEACEGKVTLTVSTVSGAQMFSFEKKDWGISNSQSLEFYDFGVANISVAVDEEGWDVVDANSLQGVNTILLASGSNAKLDLVIIPTQENEKYGELRSVLEQGENALNILVENETNQEVKNDKQVEESKNVTAGDYETAYQNFLDATAFMETDNSWNDILETQYGLINRAGMKASYLSFVAGATEEEWNNMSPYEVFVYCETYLRWAGFANERGAMEQKYVLNGDESIEQYENLYFAMISQTGGNDKEKVIEALHEVVLWQTNYYHTNNYPFNFVTGKSYAEETQVDFYNKEENVSEEIKEELTDEEYEEILEEFEEEKKEVKGMWQEVLDIILSQWLTIIILIIVTIAWLVVRHIRKKRAIDEMTADGK